MKNKRLNIFCCFVILLGSHNALHSQNKTNYKTLKSISEVKKNSPDTCYLKCFVVSSYTCPPCPPGMICKPCLGDHLSVADDPKEKKFNFRLFTKEPQKYKIGKQYTFLVRLLKTGGDDVYEANIVEK